MNRRFPAAILEVMKRAILCMTGLALLAASTPLACADELKLKDGTKIVGNIVGFEGDSFKVETSYGFALVKKDKVASIVVSESKSETKKPAPPAVTEVPAPVAAPAVARAIIRAGMKCWWRRRGQRHERMIIQ